MENKLQYYMRVLKGASFEKLAKVVDNAHKRSGKNKAAILLDMINCTMRWTSIRNVFRNVLIAE